MALLHSSGNVTLVATLPVASVITGIVALAVGIAGRYVVLSRR